MKGKDKLMNNSRSESYAAAGVDITAGYRAVELMKDLINKINEPNIPVNIRRKLGIMAQHEMLDQPDRLDLIKGFLGK